MTHRAVVCALAVTLAASACAKRPPKYDQATPRTAVEEFFGAINKGQIPAQLERLLHDDYEVASWRARCKFRGCKRATFEIVDVAMTTEARATVTVNYQVYGERDATVARGQRSPFLVIREGDRWYIAQVGKRTTVHGGPNADHDASAPAEADGTGAEP